MVYILLARGFEESEALVPAGPCRAGAEVAGGAGRRRGHRRPRHHREGRRDPGPGGRGADADAGAPWGMGGVEAIQMNLFAMALVQQAYDKGCWLWRHLRGPPTILAQMGLLDRRRRSAIPTGGRMGSPW